MHCGLPVSRSTPPGPASPDPEKAEKNATAQISSVSSDTSSDVFANLVDAEKDHQIKYRTLSWQKVTLLLFAEYLCLGLLALPWSFTILGWAAGLTVQCVIGLITWYTSYILWQFCMKHPGIHDICDIATLLFPWFPRVAYEITTVMLCLNNIMACVGFHVFTGAKIFNTLSNHSTCTVWYMVITTVIGIIVSLPRTLAHVSLMSVISGIAMAIALVLALTFVAIGDHPAGDGTAAGAWPNLGPVKSFGGWPNGERPSFINGFNAVLNITFLWIGQILYPSFIAEMKRPQDFPKALACLTAMELGLFCVCSVVAYHYLGQYVQAPFVASITNVKYIKASYGFTLVPTFVIGAIYSNVMCKFLYKRIMGNSRHGHSHTFLGWGVWILLVVVIWIAGFILANVIPSMGDFLSITSAAFDSFFGFIFWAMAYWQINRGRLFASVSKAAQTILNVILFAFGLFLLGPGLYTSVMAIVITYRGGVRRPFTCESNSII